jgi:hypothetical protein
VAILVMDNDSTTLARVKAVVNPNISKKSDSNHTKTGFTGNLVDLSNKHKVLRNVKVMSHIERCFMYCVRQNENNEQRLKNDPRTIVPHLYGKKKMHTYCIDCDTSKGHDKRVSSSKEYML